MPSKTDPLWTVIGVMPFIRNSYCKYILQARALWSQEKAPITAEELAARFESIKPVMPAQLTREDVDRLYVEEALLFVEFLPEMGTRLPLTPAQVRESLKRYARSHPALVAEVRRELMLITSSFVGEEKTKRGA